MAIYRAQTKLENYIDFQDVEPKNPVKGQKYYDGEKVNTWNGQEWEVVVNPTQLEKDIASAAQSGENAGAAADEAMTEAKGARSHANSAVDKADKANEDITIIFNTVDRHTSQISSLGDNLNLRVEKDDIINQINISDESILIDSGKTHITGKTTIDEGVISTAHIKDAAITSAKIKSITAGKIEAGTVKGLVLASESATGKFNVEGQRAVFENTNDGRRLEMDDRGFVGYDPAGKETMQFNRSMVTSAKFGTSNTNAYIATGGPDGQDGEVKNGELRVVKYTDDLLTSGGAASAYDYTPVRAQGFVGNYLDMNSVVPNRFNFYLRVPEGQEFRISELGTTTNFQNLRAKDLYVRAAIQENPDSSNFYVGMDNELRVTSRGTTNIDSIIYRNVRADTYFGNIFEVNNQMTYSNIYLRPKEGGRVHVTKGGSTSVHAPIVASDFLVSGKGSIVRKMSASRLNFVAKKTVLNDDDEEDNISLHKLAEDLWEAVSELSSKNKDLESQLEILRKEVNNE
ncbi:MAG: alanine-zipper protein [Tetragenococcus koreensis]|nr:alanine-zipper protein [Tetragenococcus koreensis]